MFSYSKRIESSFSTDIYRFVVLRQQTDKPITLLLAHARGAIIQLQSKRTETAMKRMKRDHLKSDDEKSRGLLERDIGPIFVAQALFGFTFTTLTFISATTGPWRVHSTNLQYTRKCFFLTRLHYGTICHQMYKAVALLHHSRAICLPLLN